MTTLRRPTARHPAVLKHRDHGRLWRLVEGAVVDAFRNHPDFLTVSGHRSAVQSVTKRVVGQLVGHAKQAQGKFEEFFFVCSVHVERSVLIIGSAILCRPTGLTDLHIEM